MNETKVKGTITEAHTQEIKEVFGEELAKKVEAAPEGALFLNLLFNV